MSSTGWTVVSRSRSAPAPAHAASESASLPSHPPSPDPGADLAQLQRQFQLIQLRWRASLAAGNGVATEFHRVIASLSDAAKLPVDSIVCVALGSLSSSFTPPEPWALSASTAATAAASASTAAATTASTAATAAATAKKGKRGKAKRVIAGGGRREVSMAQLVAMEEWIALLRRDGHPLPALGPLAIQRTTPAEGEESRKEGFGPCIASPAAHKYIQDPLLNSLDAAFLASLGWTVLSSRPEACRPLEEPRRRTTDNAAAYLTPSTFLFAPHAPHGLVRWLLLQNRAQGKDTRGAERAGVSGVSSASPAVYVGNELLGAEEYGAQGDEAMAAWRRARVADTAATVKAGKTDGDLGWFGIWVYGVGEESRDTAREARQKADAGDRERGQPAMHKAEADRYSAHPTASTPTQHSC